MITRIFSFSKSKFSSFSFEINKSNTTSKIQIRSFLPDVKHSKGCTVAMNSHSWSIHRNTRKGKNHNKINSIIPSVMKKLVVRLFLKNVNFYRELYCFQTQ